MSSYEPLISLFFRLLDLCIIIGLGVFIFFRWTLPVVKREIKEESDAWQQLHGEIQSHCERKELLGQVIKEDQETVRRLKSQIDMWGLAIQDAQKDRLVVKKHIEQRLQQVHHIRQMHIEQQALYKEVVPKALQEAEQELKAAFSDTSKAQQFITDILTSLEKRSA